MVEGFLEKECKKFYNIEGYLCKKSIRPSSLKIIVKWQYRPTHSCIKVLSFTRRNTIKRFKP